MYEKKVAYSKRASNSKTRASFGGRRERAPVRPRAQSRLSLSSAMSLSLSLSVFLCASFSGGGCRGRLGSGARVRERRLPSVSTAVSIFVILRLAFENGRDESRGFERRRVFWRATGHVLECVGTNRESKSVTRNVSRSCGSLRETQIDILWLGRRRLPR